MQRNRATGLMSAGVMSVVTVLAVGACGAAAPGGAPATAPSPAAQADAGALCAFLAAEAPELASAGSAAGALARFAGDFASWVGQDPSRLLTDPRRLDVLSIATCPQARAAVLESLGADSFAGVLGG